MSVNNVVKNEWKVTTFLSLCCSVAETADIATPYLINPPSLPLDKDVMLRCTLSKKRTLEKGVMLLSVPCQIVWVLALLVATA